MSKFSDKFVDGMSLVAEKVDENKFLGAIKELIFIIDTKRISAFLQKSGSRRCVCPFHGRGSIRPGKRTPRTKMACVFTRSCLRSAVGTG